MFDDERRWRILLQTRQRDREKDKETNEEIEIEKIRRGKFTASSEAKKDGFTAVAVVLMHSYAYPEHEILVGNLAKEIGFEQISLSSALTPMARAVPRATLLPWTPT